MEIKTPLLSRPIGAGDLVKAALTTVGIEQGSELAKKLNPDGKGCGCAKTQAALNRMLSFKPAAQPGIWTVPPYVPDNWRLHRECASPKKIIRLFVNESTGGSAILDIINGAYSNYRGFCCGTLRGRAEEEWEKACRLL